MPSPDLGVEFARLRADIEALQASLSQVFATAIKVCDLFEARAATLQGQAVRMQALENPEVESRDPVLFAMQVTAREFGVPVKDLLGKSHAHAVTRPRMVVMYLLRSREKWSLPRIGQQVGRDYSTVRHGVRTISAALSAEPELVARVARIELVLDGRTT